MTIGRRSSVEASLRTLSVLGAAGDAEDRALLARFAAGRDGGDEAFRILVERHGPMVFRVCRQVIGDVQLAEDAAQAVFLVLARKAASIRVDGSLGPWLHGVSRRVSAKARGRALNRSQAEARSAGVAATLKVLDAGDAPAAEDWDLVHAEVGRLPEKYRTPVVLCYLEDQTYEQAARQIGCPIGTVRVRLSRARERLRSRLTRHGFGPAQVVALGLNPAEPGAALPLASAGFADAAVYGIGRVEATLRAVRALGMSREALAGTIASSVLNLYQAGMQTMMIHRWMTAGACLMAAGITGAGTIVFATAGAGTQEKAETTKAAPPNNNNNGGAKGAAPIVDTTPTKQEDEPPLVLDAPAMRRQRAEKRHLLAKKRFETQIDFYEEGRITIDRVIDASRQLMLTEVAMSTAANPRLAPAKAHLDRMARLLKHDRLEFEKGRSTIAEVTEIGLAHEEALDEYQEAIMAADPSEIDALKRRVDKLEKELEALKPKPTELEPIQQTNKF